MRPRTHRSLDPRLTGSPVELGEGFAVVEMTALPEMAADETGLIHGGFVFGLADHAAMLAVNEPTVVLAAAEVRFRAPAVVGDRLRATARTREREGAKTAVEVLVAVGPQVVFTGDFTCVTPEVHVLDGRTS